MLRVFFLLLLPLLLLLSSCAREVQEDFFPLLAAAEPVFYRIEIKRNNKLQLGGLLAVQEVEVAGRQERVSKYQLLDSTGITLLSWQWPEKEMSGVLQGSFLASFIKRAMARIFRVMPQPLPCSGRLTRLCVDLDKHGRIAAKSFTALSFLWWKVSAEKGGWRYNLYPARVEMELQQIEMEGEAQ